jgi:lipid-binding SYLF domain-containing protein
MLSWQDRNEAIHDSFVHYTYQSSSFSAKGDTMHVGRNAFAAGIIAAALLLNGCASAPGRDTPAEKRAEVQRMRSNTLAELYRVHPPARARVQKAVGYAVFSNVGVNVILLSAAGGWGVAHDNRTGRDIYMKMVSGGIGLGLGVKDFRGVFVFTTPQAFENFTQSGWEASGQADAAAKASGKGGALAGAATVAPGMDLYQLTENGLALQATIQGTKYYQDDELNTSGK